MQSCHTQNWTEPPTNVKQAGKSVTDEEVQTKVMQTEKIEHSNSGDNSEGWSKEESSSFHSSIDAEKDNLSVSSGEVDTGDHEGKNTLFLLSVMH